MTMQGDTSGYFRINEIKNYLYCPRIAFYTLCMGIDRETGLSRAGIEAEATTKVRIKRRRHAVHAAAEGVRHFDVLLASHRHQLVGRLDEIVETPEGVYLIDYKDTTKDFGYWSAQMYAYHLCAEEMGWRVLGSYIYSIPSRKYFAAKETAQHQKQLAVLLKDVQRMVADEICPPPSSVIGKCRVCQYARFCNDVF